MGITQETEDRGCLPLFLGIDTLPATLADARRRNGISIHPAPTGWSRTYSATYHLAGIVKTTDLANTGLLLASSALLVWQLARFSYYGLKGDIAMKGRHRACP
jgi:hypothetical protein